VSERPVDETIIDSPIKATENNIPLEESWDHSQIFEDNELESIDDASEKTTTIDSNGEVKEPQKKIINQKFGIIIDSVGFDGFYALGFLEELYKRKLNPSMVAGTGFGCWIALSWALENSPRQAEWQAMKWNSWPGFNKSWISKFGFNNSKVEFERGVKRFLSGRTKDQYKIPFECPLLGVKQKTGLRVSPKLSEADLLWYQLQIPSLGGNPNQNNSIYNSGVYIGLPSFSELAGLKQFLLKDQPYTQAENFWGWIIIRTRKVGELDNNLGLNSQYLSRLEQKTNNHLKSPGNTNLLILDISKFRSNPSATSLKDINQRRLWLLEGRQKASEVFNSLGEDIGLDDLIKAVSN